MFTVRQETVIAAPCQRCFDLARNVDFHVVSARDIAARAEGGRCTGLSEEADSTVWSARFLGVRSRMTTRIEGFVKSVSFRDCLTAGLLRRFEHTYRFRPLHDEGCAMSDELVVEAPGGLLGGVIERFYLRRRMHTLMTRRLAAIKRAAESDEWQRYLPR